MERIINEHTDDYQDELQYSVDDQITNLNNLGLNYINNPNIVSQEIWTSILLFYHRNYGTIINLDYILLDEKSILRFGNYIYLFIVMDLLNILLPKTAKNAGLNDIRDLISFPLDQIKLLLISIISSKLTILNNIKSQIQNINIYNDTIKYTFYMDLVDSDFGTLYNNLLLPIMNRYEPEINNLIIKEV